MEKDLLLEVEYLPILDIRPYARNSRRNEQTIDQVVISLKTYGWKQPIVIDDNNTIVAGHSRWLAAQKIGYESVPVVRFKGTIKDARYYRLLDNRSQENSDWDYDLLKGELLEISDLPIGFTDQEIEKILGKSTISYVEAEKSVFEVVVYCDNENEQRELYDYIVKDLKKTCRVLSI